VLVAWHASSCPYVETDCHVRSLGPARLWHGAGVPSATMWPRRGHDFRHVRVAFDMGAAVDASWHAQARLQARVRPPGRDVPVRYAYQHHAIQTNRVFVIGNMDSTTDSLFFERTH
jgi:hypothetical protein